MLPEMLDHIIRTFFPHIWKAPSGSLREVSKHSPFAILTQKPLATRSYVLQISMLP